MRAEAAYELAYMFLNKRMKLTSDTATRNRSAAVRKAWITRKRFASRGVIGRGGKRHFSSRGRIARSPFFVN